MTPTQHYLADIEAGNITDDSEQRRILAMLDEVCLAVKAQVKPDAGLFSRLRRGLSFSTGTETVQGLYLWGGVGRGKTYLMDLFCKSLDQSVYLRTHFHRFMQRVHQDLTRYQGHKNPLQLIAADIANEARVLCFDEFFVLDIGDAMILAGLLQALFERGLVLVTTSNIVPAGLYANGLQRERFLPAIDLIESRTRVVQIANGTDYRLRSLSQAQLYHFPVTAETDAVLGQSFTALCTDQLDWQTDCEIEILGRRIAARQCAGDTIWFDFEVICGGPRSAFDYVEIARLYHALIVSNVPVMTDRDNDLARRFVNLVDALYERQVKLILSAAAPLDGLYQGETLAFEFERTYSRLIEMQSREYLGRSHSG